MTKQAGNPFQTTPAIIINNHENGLQIKVWNIKVKIYGSPSHPHYNGICGMCDLDIYKCTT